MSAGTESTYGNSGKREERMEGFNENKPNIYLNFNGPSIAVGI